MQSHWTRVLPIAALIGCGGPEAAVEPTRGPQIAFVSNSGGDYDLYLLDVDRDSVVNLTNHPGTDYGFSWSPSGDAIAFASDRDGNEEIYVLQLESEALTRITDHEARDGSPSWSPDGQQIAFVSRRDAGSAELYVMNADGSNVRRLTENERYEEVPSWSPEGDALVFGAIADGVEGESGTLQIFRIELASGEESQLTALPGHNSAPRWTPDGSSIVFYGQVGEGFAGADIMSIDPNGKGLRNLTSDLEPDWQPDVDPSGDLVVLARGPGEPLDLWTIRVDGSDLRPLLVRPGRDEQPKWRPSAR